MFLSAFTDPTAKSSDAAAKNARERLVWIMSQLSSAPTKCEQRSLQPNGNNEDLESGWGEAGTDLVLYQADYAMDAEVVDCEGVGRAESTLLRSCYLRPCGNMRDPRSSSWQDKKPDR